LKTFRFLNLSFLYFLCLIIVTMFLRWSLKNFQTGFFNLTYRLRWQQRLLSFSISIKSKRKYRRIFLLQFLFVCNFDLLSRSVRLLSIVVRIFISAVPNNFYLKIGLFSWADFVCWWLSDWIIIVDWRRSQLLLLWIMMI